MFFNSTHQTFINVTIYTIKSDHHASILSSTFTKATQISSYSQWCSACNKYYNPKSNINNSCHTTIYPNNK